MEKCILKKSAFWFCTILFLTGCSKEANENSGKHSGGCTPNGPCANVFISAVIKIKQPDNSGYLLDSFKTVRKEDGKILNPDFFYIAPESMIEGTYPVFNDSFIDLTNQNGKEFYFIGYKNSAEVVREKYIFSHDCCHIVKKEGAVTIVR